MIIIGTSVCIVTAASAAACYQSRISGQQKSTQDDELDANPGSKSIEDLTYEQMRSQQNRQLHKLAEQHLDGSAVTKNKK